MCTVLVIFLCCFNLLRANSGRRRISLVSKTPCPNSTARRKESKQSQVLKTPSHWEELESQQFLTEVTIFLPSYTNAYSGNIRPRAQLGELIHEEDREDLLPKPPSTRNTSWPPPLPQSVSAGIVEPWFGGVSLRPHSPVASADAVSTWTDDVSPSACCFPQLMLTIYSLTFCLL